MHFDVEAAAAERQRTAARLPLLPAFSDNPDMSADLSRIVTELSRINSYRCSNDTAGIALQQSPAPRHTIGTTSISNKHDRSPRIRSKFCKPPDTFDGNRQ
jgi:hypothetical protein